ncbi:beta-ketoacyl synthase [Candidatus Scalindua japonica]|uniref:Beta-ketoacyl synthase n=1 Tax=Candidatus Scalindua japonica TaxID=1284222 RepID=A0A286TWJ6_9BACT|nr:type I polyketide synthase [Candidatus Scalindua japonica]GAX60248.1 beta-ketoacyl synthase [Candidatus Scalindua japonica]
MDVKEILEKVKAHKINNETAVSLLKKIIKVSNNIKSNDTLYTTTVWHEQSLQSSSARELSLVDMFIIVDSQDKALLEAIALEYPKAEVINFTARGKAIDEAVETRFIEVFDKVKSCLEAKPNRVQQILILVPDTEERYCYAPLAGLIKTAHIENPRIQGKVIYYPEIAIDHTQQLLSILKQESTASTDHDIEVRYRTDLKKRKVKRLTEVTLPAQAADPARSVKPGGVYWITGGLGGLGRIFAQHLGKTKEVKLVVSGRSKLDGENENHLSALQQAGISVSYIQADISKRDDTATVIKTIKEKYGRLNGVIHSAGVIRDAFILKKTEDQIKAVLSPKVSGAINLDIATKDERLDFMIFFSSLAGVSGSIGQSDYAGANAFLDAFAAFRQGQVKDGKRYGRTLSIGWSLWRDGGMQVDEQAVRMMEQVSGIVPLQTEAGVDTFDRALGSDYGHVVVSDGDLVKMRDTLLRQSDMSGQTKLRGHGPKQKTVADTDQKELEEKAVSYFKKQLSSTLKIPVQRIDADTPFEKFGIDSVMIMNLTGQLEKAFGPLSKTLFFEYRNINEMAGYFIKSHQGLLVQILGVGNAIQTFTDKQTDDVLSLSSFKRGRFAQLKAVSSKGEESGPLDIAIIGVSGRYPGARDLQEFWENLKSGRDCITEIPRERWDHSKYYDADKSTMDKIHSKWGGFIDDVDKFDPLFFNISPREAEFIDPQERLFLETVWETLEDAGYTREFLNARNGNGLPGNVGVYAGVMYEEYQLFGVEEGLKGRVMALSGSPSSIANRVSYFCDFHGPSMAVDTMCSSSLTTIHLACQSLKTGDCELALAGGVNVSIHPNKYIGLTQGKFISSKGRCESFGQGGDGYVPGEGVGCVLLKPLQKAIDDGDHIYAVVKGTAVNHGGKTNGYTVPNPNAQGTVIGDAIKESRVNPRHISYIEAHGTGTSLGDPIEITGLSKAYQTFTDDSQFCVIGSAKSNIGHCESAAGIAGLTKVLLQLKYRKLVPSLHSETLNPNIDFSQTPFVVQQEFAEWERPVIKENGQEKECPRIAGISSFGAGGSNAHVIVEEYVSEGSPDSGLIEENAARPVLMVLSARNGERLKNYAERLLRFIEGREQRETECFNLSDIAYTLQVGREAMDSRMAFLVNDEKGLINKLGSFAAGKDDIDDCYTGEVKRNKETLTVFTADDDIKEAIDKWVAKGKLGKLAELWTRGLVLDWDLLYGEQRPKRVSLPTYPFARERYWVPEAGAEVIAEGNGGVSVLHPLLGSNTSDLTEQQFTTRLTGGEFFLKDHRVQDEKVLPGVAYIEMARAAGQLATKSDVVRIRNMVWSSPVRVNSVAREVSISLYPEGNHIAFEVSSPVEGDERMVHGQGKLEVGDCSLQNIPKSLDIEGIQSRCSELQQGVDCYKAFAGRGLNYGPSFQGIESLSYNDSEALARLKLPDIVTGQAERFVLHPSLLDGALQAVAGLVGGNAKTGPQVTLLPFALSEVMIYGPIPESAYAYVRYSPGVDPQGQVLKYDIEITDELGQVVVKLKEFTVRVLQDARPSVQLSTAQAERGVLYTTTQWYEQSLQSGLAQGTGVVESLVIVDSQEEALLETIALEYPKAEVISLAPRCKAIYKVVETRFIEVFDKIKSCLGATPNRVQQILILVLTRKRVIAMRPLRA